MSSSRPKTADGKKKNKTSPSKKTADEKNKTSPSKKVSFGILRQKMSDPEPVATIPDLRDVYVNT